MNITKTIRHIALSTSSFDTTIFKYLYSLELNDLIDTLVSSGLQVKPVHVIKQEIIKPLTHQILEQVKSAKARPHSKESNEVLKQQEFKKHIHAVYTRYKKLKSRKQSLGQDDYRRCLRALRSEMLDIASLPLFMTTDVSKKLANEIFKVDYIITSEMLLINCDNNDLSKLS